MLAVKFQILVYKRIAWIYATYIIIKYYRDQTWDKGPYQSCQIQNDVAAGVASHDDDLAVGR